MSAKKLLLAILAIGAGVIIITGGTGAFVSDTESSNGNTFVAGDLNLKVDSQGHYNGIVCKDGVWVQSCVPTSTNLLQNGDFENPTVTSDKKWDIYPSGTLSLGWNVEWVGTQTTFGSAIRPLIAQVEFHRGVNGWLPSSGNQYAELDADWDGPNGSLNGEPALVKIYQDVNTVVGNKYRLSFKFSPRPGTGADNNKLKVNLGGTQVADLAANGSAISNTAWEYYEYEVITTSTTTRVEFVGGGLDESYGVFLDEVKLSNLDCRSNSLVGQSCASTWELTDLGPTTKFFDLNSVKPNDKGENTISLHVDTNDAYACLLATNLRDDDNGLTKPEALVDSTDGPGNGELGEHVTVFIWRDDGDNIWEPGEEPLLSNPVTAQEAFDNKYYALYTPVAGALAGDTTSYVGLAWCAGTLTANISANSLNCNGSTMGNESQTDSLKVDLSFQVEQARNNPNFICQPPEDKHAHLIVVKHVINDDGGIKLAADFTMNVTGTNVSMPSFTGSETGTNVTLDAGAYSVDENFVADYNKTLGADCAGTIAVGETKTCIVTNNDVYVPPKCILQITKQVNKTTANPGEQLTYTINFKNIGKLNCTGGGVKIEDTVNPLLTYVTETHSSNVDAGYYGSVFDGSILRWNAHTVVPGQSGWVSWSANIKQPPCGPFDIPNTARISANELNWQWVESNTVHTTGTRSTCDTILLVKKHVINDNGGTKQARDFTMKISMNSGMVLNLPGSEDGTAVTVEPGTYIVDEVDSFGYTKTIGAGCGGIIVQGETKTCTVTNDDPLQCVDLQVKSKGYWINHPSQWILPQILGSEIISTAFQAQEVFVRYSDTMRNRVRGQLLALKFSIAYFGAGGGQVPGESITLAQLAAQADALLNNPSATYTQFEAMKNRLEAVNIAEHVQYCAP
jgi:uncharacterized repeat protein (TIGR01451 family)/predicted ribosomally synthesized peptide with SipW-like signal peptide